MEPTEPINHEAFPRDDRLYRIFWGGEILLPRVGNSTSQHRCWLREVDESGRDIPTSPNLCQVTESVGSIPRLVLGSFWRNGRKSYPKSVRPPPPEWLEVVAPNRWTIARAGDPIPRPEGYRGSSHTYINRSDVKLIFPNNLGNDVYGHNARVIQAFSTDGREVIIPCYEIFRAFYGGTSDLSSAMIGNTWDDSRDDFIVASARSTTPDGEHLSLSIPKGVPGSAVRYLCLLDFHGPARAAANNIYPSLLTQSSSPLSAWLMAAPPFLSTNFRIQAHTIELPSRRALLVTQICAVDFPFKVVELTIPIACQDVPLPDQTIEKPAPPEEESARKTKPGSVSLPKDARPTKRFLELPSVAVGFVGLPNPKRDVLSKRFIPLDGRKPSSDQEPELRQVSVGVPGKRPAPSRAQFTPTEQFIIEDRFQAIFDVVNELVDDGTLEAADPCAIVRPAPPDAPMFCEFPSHKSDGTPNAWATVRGPEPRPRLALVLKLQMKCRTIYWIETEATAPNDQHHSLAIEFLNATYLDEGTLETLLDLCAEKVGIWPSPLGLGHGSFVATRARHVHVKGETTLRPSTMTIAFSRLQAAIASAESAAAKATES